MVAKTYSSFLKVLPCYTQNIINYQSRIQSDNNPLFVCLQHNKMLRLRGKVVEEDLKDSGADQRDEEEGLGPRSNVSLLDQHQVLKEKAEGMSKRNTHSGFITISGYCVRTPI